MGKQQQIDATRTKPLTLETLREYGALADISPPAGRFDPNGTWKHTYQIWLVERGASGYLRLERSLSADGRSVGLSVEMSVVQATRAVYQTKVDLQCAPDALSTPRSWRIESMILDPKGQPIDVAKVAETATVKDGTIEVTTGKHTFVRKVPSVLTSNWSLFDVVQRLSGKETKPLGFALLEDLDLLKEGQRLSYWQTTKIELGGKAIPLCGYQQTGAGILPYQYWVDDPHRLLFAISGVRAYILDPNAQKRMEQSLKKAGPTLPSGKGRRKKG